MTKNVFLSEKNLVILRSRLEKKRPSINFFSNILIKKVHHDETNAFITFKIKKHNRYEKIRTYTDS